MGTEVLRPQEYLVERFPIFHGRRNYSPTKTNRKSTVVRTDHKKLYNQNQQHQQQKESTSPKNDLEIGQVTIVKRGDSLDSLNSRIKKDRRIRNKPAFDPADIYAGSSCSVSPSPSSLPLPTFFKKPELKSFDDSATRDLRRLLRLE